MILHPDPAAFIAKSGEYGALGRTVVALSNLEFTHDQFVFAMVKAHPKYSLHISNDFPRHFPQKIRFLTNSVADTPKLRTIPIFASGELNLLWLKYQLEELYEIRSILAHGSIFYSETTPDRISWQFDRFVKANNKEKVKNQQKRSNRSKVWTVESVKMSNGYLASVHETAFFIKRYLVSLIRCLETGQTWEKEYQIDKEIRRNRREIHDLRSIVDIRDDAGWIEAFPPLPPIE